MNNPITKNIIRFLVIILLQVLVFKQIQWANFNYLSIIIYPVVIMLLPIKIRNYQLLLIAFVTGLFVDMFYDSPGVHASAAVFTAFIRPFVLNLIEPRGGYGINTIPSKHHLGINWFILYASIITFAHLFFYFSVEAFTFHYFLDIWLKTIISFIFSMIFILIHHFLFNPKQ